MSQQTAIIGVDVPPQLAAIPILRDNGFTFEEIAKSQGVSRRSVYNRLQKLPAQLSLTSKKRIKQALQSHDLLVQGLPVGQVETVRAADVNTAVNRVLDRHQPLKGTGDEGSHVSYTQVNINVFSCE
jgi:hypothetical protein